MISNKHCIGAQCTKSNKEHIVPAGLFYNTKKADKHYTHNASDLPVIDSTLWEELVLGVSPEKTPNLYYKTPKTVKVRTKKPKNKKRLRNAYKELFN